MKGFDQVLGTGNWQACEAAKNTLEGAQCILDLKTWRCLRIQQQGASHLESTIPT
jgi:hypothetical protein